MPNHIRSLFTLAMVTALALAGEASAAPMLYSARFDVVFSSDTFPTMFDSLSVQVEAHFEFDPAVLDAGELQEFTPLPLTSFSSSLNPIGSTTFDTTNVFAQVLNGFGNVSIAIGGVENGVSGIGSEDFIFVLENPFDLTGAGSTPTFGSADIVLADGDAGTAGPPSSGIGTATFTLVPEPGSMVLAGFGALTMLQRRRAIT